MYCKHKKGSGRYDNSGLKIVTTTAVLPPGYPADIALQRLAAAGFDALDMAFDYCVRQKDSPCMSENWREWAEDLRRKAEDLGVSYTHSHSSGDAASLDGPMVREFELCGAMDIPMMVIHPVFAEKGGRIYESEDEFLTVNVPLIRKLLPLAEKYGVTVLSENLLWGTSIRPESISRLVKEVDHPLFGWCFDTGHANCFDIKPDILTKLDVTPLSLHIHDNHGGFADEHLLPGDGNIVWKEFLDSLKKAEYKGELVLEAHHQSLEADDTDREKIFRELYARARKMREYLESTE